MSSEEKFGVVRIVVIELLSFICMSCIMLTLFDDNMLFRVGIILSLEFLILFLYITNKPLITADKYETIYQKIIYKIPNYKSRLNSAYSLIGVIMNIFITVAIMQYRDAKNYLEVSSYNYLIELFSYVTGFWLACLLNSVNKLKYKPINVIKMFDIFDKCFNFNNVDNKLKINEINFLKYEIQFNKTDFFEVGVNIFKKILAVIGLIGLTNLIKDVSTTNIIVIVIISTLFIFLDFIFNNLQKTKNQVLYILDMYIEKLKEEIEIEEKQQNNVTKITKRRNRR